MIMERTKRIEYIDAMRGFTMFLVVATHVSGFDLGFAYSDSFYYGKFFSSFRMPLFFFVSGFVLYKREFNWSLTNAISFLKKKLFVQIISPFLFFNLFVIYTDQSVMAGLFDYQKCGYWFTFTLFEFFLFYILQRTLCRMLFSKRELLEDFFVFLTSLLLYLATIYTLVTKFSLDDGIYGLLGVPNWHYFVFFCMGTLVKKHFVKFEMCLDSKYFLMICLCCYILLVTFSSLSLLSNTMYSFSLSVLGVVIVFSFFRMKQNVFCKSNKFGEICQYVGRHTLDIYLIHYFFIFSNMQAILPNFAELNTPFLEFVFSCLIASLIIFFSLIVSEVLRISPLLAHYLFGQKITQQN